MAARRRTLGVIPRSRVFCDDLPANDAPFMREMSFASAAIVESHSVKGRMGDISYTLHLADCLHWMDLQSANSVHAIVTDPPFGLREYTQEEKTKLRSRRGGVWRIPPSYDGYQRSPVPRFTVLTERDRERTASVLLTGLCLFAQRNL